MLSVYRFWFWMELLVHCTTLVDPSSEFRISEHSAHLWRCQQNRRLFEISKVNKAKTIEMCACKCVRKPSVLSMNHIFVKYWFICVHTLYGK